MDNLHTERLTLREFNLDDAGFILELLNDPDFIRFIGDRNVRSLDDARKYLNGPFESYQRNGFGLWLVEDSANQTPLGMCGLIRRDILPDVDIGYAFLPQFRAQGFAYEAARAALDFGRDTLKLKRVLAVVSPENDRSIHLLTRLGLKFERMFTWPQDGAELKLFAIDL
jgi:RimJ/RimL family protein N-acetyltransferase